MAVSGGACGSGGAGSDGNRLPKLFVLIERNQWSKVEERVRRHPREAARWATVRKGRPTASSSAAGMSTPERCGSSTLSSSEFVGTPGSVITSGGGGACGGTGTPDRQVSRVQCKALHHACQKLRSVYYMPPSSSSSMSMGGGRRGTDTGDDDGEKEQEETDPYVSACKAIVALVEAHPQAAGERESRHGCLPLHLAVFGMCGSGSQHHHQQQYMVQSPSPATATPVAASSPGGSRGAGHLARPGIVGRESSVPVDLDEVPSGEDDDDECSSEEGDIVPPPTPSSTVHSASAPSSPAIDVDEVADEMIGLQTCKSDPISLAGSLAETLSGNACGMLPVARASKPPKISSSSGGMPVSHGGGHHKRGHSHDTHDFSLMGMSQIIQSETFGGHKDRIGSFRGAGFPSDPSGSSDRVSADQAQRKYHQQHIRRPDPISTQSRAQSAPVKSVISPAAKPGGASYVISTTTSYTRRDHFSLLVLNALLDAYPRAVKTDSEGGRLPLHTAISGQASSKAIRTLIRAYPDAARQRTKDGYLPLHLAAHWGVSSLDVVSALLKAYPDAIQGRNRFERTPLEEAVVMAGENGRTNQVGLVRALRRHPTYWAGSGASAELSTGMAGLNLGHGGDPLSGGGRMMTDLQGLLSPESGRVGRGRSMLPPSSTMVDVDASFDDDDSDELGEMGHHNAVAPGGFMSRISPRLHMGKPKAAARSATDAQSQAAKAVAAKTDLVTLIRSHSYQSIPHRLCLYPKEASQPLHTAVRGGYPAKVTPLYLACEYNPTVDVVKLFIDTFKDGCGVKNVLGGQLPLHGACTWNASSSVISLLLEAYPAAAQQRDDLGNLPLHCACFSGASEDIVEALLKAYPLGVSVTNGQGSAPSHIVRRLRHQNRSAILRVLGSYEEKMSKRRLEAEQVTRPRPLQQDQRQESVETSLRSSSSSPRLSGRKSRMHAPASERPSARQQRKVDVRASGPGDDDSSEQGMLWV